MPKPINLGVIPLCSHQVRQTLAGPECIKCFSFLPDTYDPKGSQWTS